MKAIKLRFSLPTAKELNSQIDKLLSKGYELKFNGDSFKSTTRAVTDEVNKIKSSINQINGQKINISTIIDKSGEKTILTYKNSITETVRETQKLGEVTRSVTTQNIGAFNSLRNVLQTQLSTASSNKLIDCSVIDNLQVKLNSLNVNTPVAEVNKLKASINSLSSGDSGIIRLESAIIRLQQRISSVKDNKINVIDKSEITELKQAEDEVNKLKALLSRLKGGEIIDGKKLSSSINTATNSVRQLENSFRNVSTASSGFTNSMRTAFSYIIGGSGVYAVINGIKNAVNTTIELDTAMRDLKRVTSETESTYSRFMQTANQTAISLGTTTSGAIEATTRFSQLGYSFSEASEKLSKYALTLSNVGNMSAMDASSAIVSILKGFKLDTNEVERIVDSLNEAGNKFAIDTNSLTEGLRVGAANLSIAGNDLEQASALIITGTEVLQDSNTVSNGLKTISMRLRGISSDGEELNAKLGELVKNLTGVDLMDANGEFRSTYDVLVDISKVFDTLNSKEQALLLEEVAGKHRANVLSSILQNADQLEKAYDTLSNSAGSSAREQEAYMNSLSGKINALKENFTGISMSMINSDFMKGFIDGMTQGVNAFGGFIDKFGAMPVTVSLAVGALAMLNNKFREMSNSMLLAIPGYGKLNTAIAGYGKNLKSNIETIKSQINTLKGQQAEYLATGESTVGLGFKMMGLNSKLALTTAGAVACNIAMTALSSLLSMGLSLLISSAVSGLSSLVDTAITTKSELKELNDEFINSAPTSSDNIKNARELIDSYSKLSDELDNLTRDTEAYKDKEEELNSVIGNLSSLYPDVNVMLDENTGRKRINEEATKSLIKSEENLLKAKSNTILNKNDIKDMDDVNSLISKYQKAQEEMEKFTKLSEQGVKTIIEGEGINKTKYYVEKYLEIATDDYEEAREQMEAVLEALKNSGNTKLDDAYNVLSSAFYDVENSVKNVEKETEKMLDTASNTSEAESSTNNLQEIYKQLGYSAKEASDRIKELNDLSSEEQSAELVKDATKAYGEAINEAKELTETIEKVNEAGSMTPELISDLASRYPELGARITDVASVQEFLNQRINDSVKAQVDAYTQMVANDNEYYNSKIRTNDAIIQSVNMLCSQFVDEQGNAYQIDLSNYSNLTQLKNKLTNDLGAGVADFISNFVSAQSGGYSVDLQNTSSWASSKAKIIQQLNNQIKKLERNMQNALSHIQSSAYTGMTAGDAEAEKLYMMANKQLQQAKAQYEEIQTEFSSYSGGFSGYKPSFSSGSFSGSSGSGNKGGSGSGSDSTAKEVKDLESLEDRYYSLMDAIDDCNNALQINKTLQEKLTGTDRIKYMNQEIELYKKQQQAVKNLTDEYKKEASELKNLLSSKGVAFDGNGNIANYNDFIRYETNKANSLSGDAKESAVEQVKELEEQLKKYTELTNNLIPAQEKEWQSLANTIKDVHKEMANAVADVEKEIYDTIKHYAEKATKAKQDEIDKQIELLNKSYQEEDRQDELNKKRQELTELRNEMAKYENAVDIKGRKRYEQILAEFEAKQEELNKIIRDNQKESMIEGMEKEKEELDKELEDLLSPANMNKLIADALSSGMVEIGGEVVDLSKAMSQMLKDTTIGTQNLININNELINSLKEAQSIYANISGINSSLGLQGVNGFSNSRSSNNGTTFTGDIIVKVPEMANGVTPEDVSSAITKALKSYDKQFK